MASPVDELRSQAPHLSVGIAAADPLRVGSTVDELAATGVRLIHLDVMDGVFCPPATTASPSIARALAGRFVPDVHLMVVDPLSHVGGWIDAGARVVTFQLEGVRHPHWILQSMAESGVARGAALAPSSPVSLLEPLLDDVEIVLLLSVDPGWPGQRFLPSTFARLRAVHELIEDRPVLVSVDGSITRDGLVSRLVDAGADIVVSGSAVFDGDPRANAQLMLSQLGGA